MRVFGSLVLALALCAGAQADVLYNSLSGTSPGEAAIGNSGFGAVLYDSFSTGSHSEVLTGLEFGLAPAPQLADPITITLYTDGGTTFTSPFSPVVLGTATSLGTLDDMLVTGPGVYAVTPPPDVVLTANTRYWIGLSGIQTLSWLQSADSSGMRVGSEFFAIGTNPVLPNSTSSPFQMEVTASAMPEPSAIFMLTGLLGFGLLRRRLRS